MDQSTHRYQCQALCAVHFMDKKSTVSRLIYYSLKSMQSLVQDFVSQLEEKPEVYPKLGYEMKSQTDALVLLFCKAAR